MSRSRSSNLEEIIIELEKHDRKRNKETCTIFRAPPNLREVAEDVFNPKLVSLGPLHRGNPKLEDMEEQKHHCLRDFLDKIPDQQPESSLVPKLRDCISMLITIMGEVRSSYYDKVKMGDEELAEMMLLDGCFIIEMLLGNVVDMPSKHLLLALDMLMLENQIPFIVIKQLHIKKGGTESEFFDLVFKVFKIFLPDGFQPPSTYSNPPSHLLHLIHIWSVPYQPKNFIIRNNERIDESIPNATKLREAGIKFHGKKSGMPLEVTFKGKELSMTPFKVYDHVMFLFRNLVAFEHCAPRMLGRYVTDYVYFIHRLINTPKDVELLHAKGLVVNGLGSAEEMAHLINNLSKNMIWDPWNNELKWQFWCINDHCKKKRSRLRTTMLCGKI